MLYIFFSKKQQFNKRKFPTSELVYRFFELNLFNPNICFIAFPGYISRYKSGNDAICREIIPGYNSKASKTPVGIFFKPLRCSIQNVVFKDLCEKFHSKTTSHKQLGASLDDHSKVFFFCEVNLSEKRPLNEIDLIKAFKKKTLKVKAILVGSSNLSKTTYCGDKKGLADKGETDVFIIKLKHLEDFVDLEPINTKNVITKNGQVIQKNRDNSLNRINMENYFISKHINEYGDEYDDQCLSDMLYSYFKKNNESE